MSVALQYADEISRCGKEIADLKFENRKLESKLKNLENDYLCQIDDLDDKLNYAIYLMTEDQVTTLFKGVEQRAEKIEFMIQLRKEKEELKKAPPAPPPSPISSDSEEEEMPHLIDEVTSEEEGEAYVVSTSDEEEMEYYSTHDECPDCEKWFVSTDIMCSGVCWDCEQDYIIAPH